MRYLLHHSDATFNATTKRFMFTLDRRMANPQSISVSKCVFTAATASSYPNVIYMRSDALHNLANIKHSVELKDADHENPTNVIAVMEETHTRGRYHMKGAGQFFPVHSHTHVRSIDIYFTDGTTVMEGVVAAGGGSSAPTGAADDATIVAIGDDINLWLDFSDFSNILMPTYAPVGVVGDEIAYVMNKAPGPSTFFFTATPNDMYVAQFGETYGMLGQGSWESLADTSDNNPVATLPYTLMWMMKIQAVPAFGVVWSIQNFLDCKFTTSNTLQYLTQTSGWQDITALNFLPGQDWYTQVICDDPDGDGNFSFFWTFRNLATGVETTEETEGRWHAGSLGLAGGTNYYVGMANTGMKTLVSHAVFLDNHDPTDIATVKNWMLAKYGVADGEEVAEPAPTEDASFFVELNIKSAN